MPLTSGNYKIKVTHKDILGDMQYIKIYFTVIKHEWKNSLIVAWVVK